MIRIEYQPDMRTGRGEEKTNDLRFKDGRLQQKWKVATIGPDQPLTETEEWRDVPQVEE
jgi:hypothetical protein